MKPPPVPGADALDTWLPEALVPLKIRIETVLPASLAVPVNDGARFPQGLLIVLRLRWGEAVTTEKWISPLRPVPFPNAPACSATAV